jgi:Ca2+-binding RTX toxin-like protein
MATNGDDRIPGTSGNNFIFALAGNDTIIGSVGNDAINGGTGSDRVDYSSLGRTINVFITSATRTRVEKAAGGGTDTLDNVETIIAPTLGSSTIYGSSLTSPISLVLTTGRLRSGTINLTLRGFSNVIGGSGNDVIIGTSNGNTIDGGVGDDLILGDGGSDTLLGGIGNDSLLGGIGNDSLDGGTGNDSLNGGADNDTYVVDSLSDIVVELTGGGTDWVSSSINYSLVSLPNVENLTLIGTAVSGTGNSARNLIKGNNLANSLFGEAENDTLEGGAGNDSLYGGSGNDSLDAGEGNDTLFGEISNDLLLGRRGNDRLNGGSGNDTLVGFGGDPLELDTLTGGTGADTFFLGELSGDFFLYNPGEYYKGLTIIPGPGFPNPTLLILDGFATITDFSRSQGDKIQAFGRASNYILTTANVSGTAALDTIISFAGGSSSDRLVVIRDTTTVSLTTDFIYFS